MTRKKTDPKPNSAPKFFEVPIGCPDCGSEIKAAVGPPDATVKPSSWTCPFCSKTQTTDFGGRLFGVLKRNEWWITWA